MPELNEWEVATLRGFAELMMTTFDGAFGIITEAMVDFSNEELQVLEHTEALVLSWDADDNGTLADD